MCRKNVLLFALSFVAGLGLSCGPRDGDEGLLIRILSEDGPPASFVAIAAFSEGDVVTLQCPGDGADARLQVFCHREGIDIARSGGALALTVKARGYRFATVQIDADVEPDDEGGKVVEIPLERIESAAAHAGYATGFSSDSPRSFLHYGVKSDGELGLSVSIKFYMTDIHSPSPRVYFINTADYRLHYDFARDVAGYPDARTQYDQDTYYAPDRTAMAGTLIYYESIAATHAVSGQVIRSPYVLTFFPSDRLTPAHAALAHRLLEERMGFVALTGEQHRLVYLPGGTDSETALLAMPSLFDSRDALWMTRRDLHGSLTTQILNPGKACGTLRHMTPEDLAAQVVSFRDILVLTRLPIELPIVGGTITEELQTPLSHVNVASIFRGTPNIALLDAARDARIAPWLGKLVCLEVNGGDWSVREVSLSEAQNFWESAGKKSPALTFDAAFDHMLTFDQMAFADRHRFGVKAANTAELHRVIPDEAPDGMAVPFHYYARFLDESVVTATLCDDAATACRATGRSTAACHFAAILCRGYAADTPSIAVFLDRLLVDAAFAGNTSVRDAALHGVRHVMTANPVNGDFAAAFDEQVASLFGNEKVRLRSSTNAEDLSDFSGAGLYDSVSARARIEGDRPSQEIRKVWASVWNFRAFEEREFWGLDHRQVYMGVLVHSAFPDEQANGVLITGNLAQPEMPGMYVNVQRGEVSVTNPLSGQTPEILSIVWGVRPGTVQSAVIAWSSLSVGVSILSDAELDELWRAARKAQRHFAPLYGLNPDDAWFDLEFKFHGPQRDLIIKQLRPFIAPQ